MYFHNIKDNRGSHIKYFSQKEFNIDEVYCTVSKKNVIRGFHQSGTQNKIIQVLNGKVLLVHINKAGINEVVLSNESDSLYIPIGDYIGYLALEDNTIVNYLAEGKYDKEKDYAISPLVYNWGIPADEMIISDRDKNAPVKNLNHLNFLEV